MTMTLTTTINPFELFIQWLFNVMFNEDAGAQGDQGGDDVGGKLFDSDTGGDDGNDGGDSDEDGDQDGSSDDGDQDGGDDDQDGDQGDDQDGGDDDESGDSDADGGDKLTLKLPENSLLAENALTRIAEYAQKQGLDQEKAQLLAELVNGELSQYSEFAKQTGADKLDQQKTEWLDQVKADKEIGGDNYEANADMVSKMVEKFATKEFTEFVNKTGIGNHPEYVRMFVRIAKAADFSEDTLEQGNASGASESTMEDRLYNGS